MASQRGVGSGGAQMDLLELSRLERDFDIVECTGVLHHLRDPLQGGRAVISRLRVGGIVHISLYSELARRGLVRVRREYGLSPKISDDEVRAFRHRLLVERPDIIDNDLGLRWDFFDLSRCRICCSIARYLHVAAGSRLSHRAGCSFVGWNDRALFSISFGHISHPGRRSPVCLVGTLSSKRA
ncbi:MAG: hypothetical protein R3F37_13285 [Candidatus Competibacteraceae bacterium]